MSSLLERQDLFADEMRAAVSTIMEGGVAEPLIAAFLTALRMKGEAVSELVGAAQAMRERATRIPCRTAGLLDTCGTGGDRLRTFNISTAAAFVASAAGVPVAKHGNRSVSSTSGSADVLEAMGVRLDLTPEAVARCVDDIGLGFCFAPLLHGAMKHVGPVRKQLGFRTIFNLLGPLTNPAGAEFQLIGTHHPVLAGRMAEALAQLPVRHVLVVCGADGLDEVSLWGETTVFAVRPGRTERRTLTAATFGLPECRAADLVVNSPQESAERIRRILANECGDVRVEAGRNMVVANAAAALVAAERTADLREAVATARDAIASGRAAARCRELVERTNAAASDVGRP